MTYDSGDFNDLKPLSIDGDVGVCVEPRFVDKPVRLLHGLPDAAIGTEAVESALTTNRVCVKINLVPVSTANFGALLVNLSMTNEKKMGNTLSAREPNQKS